jgi:hypothetical protein
MLENTTPDHNNPRRMGHNRKPHANLSRIKASNGSHATLNPILNPKRSILSRSLPWGNNAAARVYLGFLQPLHIPSSVPSISPVRAFRDRRGVGGEDLILYYSILQLLLPGARKRLKSPRHKNNNSHMTLPTTNHYLLYHSDRRNSPRSVPLNIKSKAESISLRNF